MPKEIPRRVGAVLASCGIVAYFSAWPIVEYLTKFVAPYLVFGLSAAREHVQVTGGTRYTVEFSNGTMIHGLRMLPVLGAWAVFNVIFILGFWILLLHIAGWFIRKRDPGFAEDVIHPFTRF
jgi:hypothetical protein